MKSTKRLRRSRRSETDRRCVIEQAPHRITGGINTLPELEMGPLEWEESLERLGILLFGLCHDVVSMSTQGREDHADNVGSKRRKHYADLHVQVRTEDEENEDIIIEFKNRTRAFSPNTMKDLRVLGESYRRQGRTFHIVTDDQLTVEPRRANAILLRRYLHSPVTEESQQRILSRLGATGRRIRELMTSDRDASTLRDVFALVARRALCIDWSVRLDRDALVCAPGHPFEGLRHDQIVASGRFHSLLQELAVGRGPTDQRLMAAARARDRSVSSPSPFGCCGGLPESAHAGRGRHPGSLVDASPCEHPQGVDPDTGEADAQGGQS